MNRRARMGLLYCLVVTTTSVYWLISHIGEGWWVRLGWSLIAWILFQLVFDGLFPREFPRWRR